MRTLQVRYWIEEYDFITISWKDISDLEQELLDILK